MIRSDEALPSADLSQDDLAEASSAQNGMEAGFGEGRMVSLLKRRLNSS
jgi:hypothetical protein